MMTHPVSSLLLDQLVERLHDKEALDLEFKSARGGIDKSVWETVSAFANTNGGWLILGVTDEGEPIGVGDGHERSKQFLDLIRNRSKISSSVCGATDVDISYLGENALVVIRVPAAPRRERPVYVGRNPYEGTFVRRGESDYRCTKPEVDRMMREASDVAADSMVLPHFDLADLDEASLASYRRRYQTQNPTSPLLGYDDVPFLQSIDGWRRDRERGVEGLTVAGLLLLGKGEAIREWRGRHLIDYQLRGDGTEERWLHRIVWEGNLLNAWDTLLARLTDDIDVPFQLSGATRPDSTPVHTAMREALANLLLHADYSEPIASLILQSPLECLFRNPGSSRVPPSDLRGENRSDPRNPTLVRMFRLIGLAEEAGTGIPAILRAWRELEYQFPEFQSPTERYEFTLILRHIHMISEADRNWLDGLGDDWSEPQQIALITARHDETIDNERLRDLTGLHPADATKALVGLRDASLLVMEGRGRGSRYRLGPKASESDLDDSGPGLDDSESDLDDSVPGLDDSESDLGDSGPRLEDLPPELEGFLSEFAEIIKPLEGRRWVPAAERDAVVLQLCSVMPLSVKELAVLLRRAPATMRETVRLLVKSGKLSQIHPHPHHPRQRYRTVSPLDEP